jgi:hypothetical protein
VYRPLELTVPQADPEQPAPETLHVTPWLLVPVTVAVNCFCIPEVTLALVGEIEMLTGLVIVTVALPVADGKAIEVAVTVTVGALGTFAGAV